MSTMTRSDSHKDIVGSINQMPAEDFLDGTSARTRPLSYEDILRRRKSKGDSAQHVPGISGGVNDSELAQDNMERASDVAEGHGQVNDNSVPVEENKKSNDSKKVRSGRNADINASAKGKNLMSPDVKSNDKRDRNARRNRVPEEKTEGRNHGRRRKDDNLSVNPDNGPDRWKDSESYKQERVSERSRVKSEIVKAQPHNDERQVFRKRKTDERVGCESDNEYKKRNVRDVRQPDDSTARGREKSVKEKKRKHLPQEDKSRGRNNLKKNDSTRTYDEESRSKRRRSRSVDREKDRGKRSLSQSPKAYKHTSIDKRELPESTKEKSGREHSNVDSKRISSSNSHYRRNTNSSSGLGGYSPRKRKTEAAAKTPSPTHRSPERRNAGWDLQPVEKESTVTSSTVSNLNTTNQQLSLNVKEYPIINPVAPVVTPIGISLQTISSQMHAIESIQLTQATRPKRRLYVENLPVSASEKNIIECINKLLLSSGVNYIKGTQPCISCIIHKEKSQALLEFLTPEDASAALSLDGMSFSGSNLKLRRPKDYANVTTGLSDKSVGVVDSISDTVEDSPNKIFICGLSKLFSSRMLLEIARLFGPVKAFHFEVISDTNEPCAFLEYVDHSVTSKACAGLNGMMLGGQVLTAVLATPESVLKNAGELPTYVIPNHAKPLIKKPTNILMLKNVLDPEGLVSLSESEIEEILEDIRLECSRFGMVRSVNVARKTNVVGTTVANDIENTSARTDVIEQLTKSTSEVENSSQISEDINGCDNISGLSDTLGGSVELKVTPRFNSVGESTSNENASSNIMKDEVCESPSNGRDVSELASNCSNAPPTSTQDLKPEQLSTQETLKSEERNAESASCKEESVTEAKNNANNVELDTVEREDDSKDLGHIFEPGSVIVEYRRPEAACMAAHCLHGRTFDGRVVTVEYVGHDQYQMGFHR